MKYGICFWRIENIYFDPVEGRRRYGMQISQTEIQMLSLKQTEYTSSGIERISLYDPTIVFILCPSDQSICTKMNVDVDRCYP